MTHLRSVVGRWPSGLLLIGAVISFGALDSEAVTITFEGVVNTTYTAPITRSGFDIGNPTGDEQHFHEIDSTGFSLPSNGTGVLLNDRDTQIFVVASGGEDFTLTSVDVASALGNGPAVGMIITGFNNLVPLGAITIATLGLGYTNVLGTFGAIDLLLFDGTGGQGGFVLDNLTLNEITSIPEIPEVPGVPGVPEPSVVLLLGAGLVGLAARARRSLRR